MRLEALFSVLAGCASAFFTARLAQAAQPPFLWMESVCRADVLVEVEVTLAARRSVRVARVIWSRDRHGQPPVLPPGILADIAARDRDDSQVMGLVRSASRRRGYRAKQFLSWQHNQWRPVGGVMGRSLVHWIDHPRHGRWWSYVAPLLHARNQHGPGRQPDFCRLVESSAFADRQGLIELGIMK
jgi:hypothetical protein